MTGMEYKSAQNDNDAESWLEWALFWYPFASVLLLGPVCLILSWNWLAMTITAVGTVIVACCFSIRHLVKLPLLVLNLDECVLALYLFIAEMESLP